MMFPVIGRNALYSITGFSANIRQIIELQTETEAPILHSLSSVMEEMKTCSSSFNPVMFRKTVHKYIPKYKDNEQMDAEEFLQDLWRRMKIEDLYSLMSHFDSTIDIHFDVRCSFCDFASEFIKHFDVIYLPTVDRNGVFNSQFYQCLKSFYSDEGGSVCPECMSDTIINANSISSPMLALFVFMRYAYNDRGDIIKREKKINFQSELMIGGEKYSLKAAVNHVGTPSVGHYTTYANHNRSWHFCDDEEISIVPVERIFSTNAYLLLYQRNGQMEPWGMDNPQKEEPKEMNLQKKEVQLDVSSLHNTLENRLDVFNDIELQDFITKAIKNCNRHDLLKIARELMQKQEDTCKGCPVISPTNDEEEIRNPTEQRQATTLNEQRKQARTVGEREESDNEASDTDSDDDEKDNDVIYNPKNLPLGWDGKTMSDKEKQRFHQMAEKDKKRYEDEMSDYTPPADSIGKKRKRTKDPNAPKRSLSAFFWFCNDERSKVKEAMPDAPVGLIAKELGRRWSAVSAETKSKYEALAAKDKARYMKEVNAYKGGSKKPKASGTKAKKDDSDEESAEEEEPDEENEEAEEEDEDDD